MNEDWIPKGTVIVRTGNAYVSDSDRDIHYIGRMYRTTEESRIGYAHYNGGIISPEHFRLATPRETDIFNKKLKKNYYE